MLDAGLYDRSSQHFANHMILHTKIMAGGGASLFVKSFALKVYGDCSQGPYLHYSHTTAFR